MAAQALRSAPLPRIPVPMAQVFSISGTIFALIALGWLLARRAVFDGRALDTLGTYVITCALPALIFRATAFRPISETFDSAYLLVFATTSLAIFVFGYWLLRRAFGCSSTAATFGAMGMSTGNSGFVGYPMLQLALPAQAEHALALNMSFENLVMIPLVLALAEAARTRDAAAGRARVSVVGPIARKLATSPVILALAAGLTVAATGLPLPALVRGSVEILADSSAAISLVVIGGVLASLRLREIGALPWLFTAVKLLAMPALAWGLFALTGLATDPPALSAALLVMAALPAMSIYPVLARRYGEEKTAAATLLLQSLASFASLTLLLALLGLPGGR